MTAARRILFPLQAAVIFVIITLSVSRLVQHAQSDPAGINSGISLTGPSQIAEPKAQAPPPVRVVMPTVDIRSNLTDLHLQEDGTLSVPADYAVAGWWAEGPRPGDQGRSIIVGHVDSKTGPAVFYRLRTVKPGDPIQVWRSDGSIVNFEVEHVSMYKKNDLPTGAVYGQTGAPALRLITCGGVFDRKSGSYKDNVVVYARYASGSAPPLSAAAPKAA